MTIDAVDRALRQANPIPESTMLEWADPDIGLAPPDDPTSGRTEVALIDIGRTPRPRASRRRLVVAAAAAALALVAGGVLVRVVTDDGAQTQVPTDPSPSATTAPAPRGGAAELPPAGATPSTPVRGELVASVQTGFYPSLDGDMSFNLFADGRLIRLGSFLGDSLGEEVRVRGVEQRLTAAGVERVRSAFLATGLFGPGPRPTTNEVASGCGCIIRVRHRGQLLSTEDPGPNSPNQLDPEVRRQAGRLVDYAIGLDSSLPASAWEDREMRAFVPSGYSLCVSGPADAEGDPHPLSDPLAVFTPRMPESVARLLARGNESCVGLTSEEARRLAEALDDARASWTAFTGLLQYRFYGGTYDTSLLASVNLTLLLPDSQARR